VGGHLHSVRKPANAFADDTRVAATWVVCITCVGQTGGRFKGMPTDGHTVTPLWFGLHEAGGGGRDVRRRPLLCVISASVPTNVSRIVLLMPLVITSPAGCHAGKKISFFYDPHISRPPYFLIKIWS